MTLPPETPPPPADPAGRPEAPSTGRGSARGPGKPIGNRRGFQPPSGTPRVQILIWLAVALVVVGMMSVYFLRRATLSAEERAEGLARIANLTPAPPVPPSPEEVAARDVRLHTLFEGSLADTRNGQGFAETPGYRHLLQILASYPSDQVASLATKKLDRAAVLADPDAWRGEFVWTRGVVANRYANRLRESVSGAEDVYQVILTDGNGEDGIIVDMLDPPPAVRAHNDPVDVQGIFYRTVQYENADKKTKVLTAPYLLAKTLLPVQEPKGDRMGILRDPTAALLVGMALALAAGRLLIYVIQRRPKRPDGLPRAKEAGFRKMFEKSFGRDGPTAGPRSEA